MERLTSWMSDNWPWLAAFIGIGGREVKKGFTLRRIEKAVFSESGDARLVRIEDCQQTRSICAEATKLKLDATNTKIDSLVDIVNDTRTDVKTLIQFHMKDSK